MSRERDTQELKKYFLDHFTSKQKTTRLLTSAAKDETIVDTRLPVVI